MNPIRIRLRYPDLDTFVERFAPNVTRGGVFLASRNVQPVGAVIPFEIQLTGGAVVLAGQGRVTWVKEFNPAEPNRPYGMGVQFVSIAPASKLILARILRAKEASGRNGDGGGPRLTTGAFSAIGSPPSGRQGSAAAGVTNGKAAAPAIDTSVDLAAEYGLDDQAIRRMIERTWMTGARASDDLSELLKPEPVDAVTLQQALAELPRLLDPQYSRRRASSSFRPLDSSARSGEIVPAAPETTFVEQGGPERAPSEQPNPEQTIVLSARDPAEVAEAAAGAPAEDSAADQEAIAVQVSDVSDTTDMTGNRDTTDSMHAITVDAEPGGDRNGDGRANRDDIVSG